jgi:anti-sigma-K factor RskA
MMTHTEAEELLASFALDAVDEDERQLVEDHLAQCPRCRAELDAHREVAAALGNSVEPVPEGLWSAIATRLPERGDEERPPMPRLLFEEFSADEFSADEFSAEKFRADEFRPEATVRGRSLRSRRRLAAVGSAVVAAAAVVVFLAIGWVHADTQVSHLQQALGQAAPSAAEAALESPGHQVVNLVGPHEAKRAQFVIDAKGHGYLVSSTLPTLAPGKTYQLWGIVGGRPVSLGLMGQSPDQSTFTWVGAAGASMLGITVEPAGGSLAPTTAMSASGTV